MQPPSDRDKKANPFTPRSPWPRAPQQTFHLKVPKPPAPGTRAAAQPTAQPKPAPAPAPPKPARMSPEDQALPTGYADPLDAPQVESFEPETDESGAPPFVAPPAAPFAVRGASDRKTDRRPLIAAAAATVLIVLAVLVWLRMREASEPPVLAEPAPAAEPSAPVITEPSLDYILPAPEDAEPEPPAPRSTAAPEPASQPAARPAPAPAAPASRPQTSTSQTPAASSLPQAPVPYSGSASAEPQAAQPQPSAPPPPPVTAPGPDTPLLDPNAPVVTRDPSTGS